MKLEKKIIDKVYRYESKKTAVEIIVRLISLILAGFLSYLFLSVVWEILAEEGTLELLDIFQEDFEVVKKYLIDVVNIIFNETPKSLIFFSGVFIFIFIIALYFFIINFKKISNKLKAVINFWLKIKKR